MGKLMFYNKVKWKTDFMRDAGVWQSERDRWVKLAKKHGLTMVGSGTPWGNDYHSVNVYTTDKGLDAWNAFTTDVLQNGTADAWKYVQDFATDIVSMD